MTAAPIAPRENLRVFRAKDPYIALGLAVSHLMTKPAFANLRFGDWSRILTGQINRKHYYFAVDRKNQIQGFMGWAVTSKEKAEAWVEGRGAVSFADSRDGDCLIFNAWAANTPEVNRFLVSQAREIMQGKDTSTSSATTRTAARARCVCASMTSSRSISRDRRAGHPRPSLLPPDDGPAVVPEHLFPS
jgi:hemolysin-activating ACP:hemolysin acyltransferase